MNDFEEDKIWKENEEARGRESVADQLPKIPEEGNGNDSGAAISKDFGNAGDRATLPEQKETNDDEKGRWNVGL